MIQRTIAIENVNRNKMKNKTKANRLNCVCCIKWIMRDDMSERKLFMCSFATILCKTHAFRIGIALTFLFYNGKRVVFFSLLLVYLLWWRHSHFILFYFNCTFCSGWKWTVLDVSSLTIHFETHKRNSNIMHIKMTVCKWLATRSSFPVQSME